MSLQYTAGADLPDGGVEWKDRNGTIIDFSTGYTFEVRVGSAGSAATFSKTTGITGAATSPNLTIQWATSGELNTLPAGNYSVQIIATRTADSRARILNDTIQVLPAILPVA